MKTEYDIYLPCICGLTYLAPRQRFSICPECKYLYDLSPDEPPPSVHNIPFDLKIWNEWVLKHCKEEWYQVWKMEFLRKLHGNTL